MMWLTLLLPLLFVVGIVVLLIAARKPLPHEATAHGLAQWEMGAARSLLGAAALFSLVMGAGEIAEGYPSGATHFLTTAVFAFFAWFAGRRPDVAGVVLTVLGASAGTVLFVTRSGGLAFQIQVALIGGVLPLFLPGLLLLLASGQRHQVAGHGPQTR